MEMPKILGYKVITKGRGATIDVKLEQIDVISKDKIREKIEFYKRYGKIKNSDEYVMSVEIEALEELLEEE